MSRVENMAENLRTIAGSLRELAKEPMPRERARTYLEYARETELAAKELTGVVEHYEAALKEIGGWLYWESEGGGARKALTGIASVVERTRAPKGGA